MGVAFVMVVEMTKSLLAQQTRIAVQMVIDDDSGQIAQFIQAFVTFVAILLAVGKAITPMVLFVSDFFQAAQFSMTVFTIITKSVAYGFVGIRC